nr:hypothetical protein [uncultured Chitinophaga sp.]
MVVKRIADLYAVTPSENEIYEVLGYYAPGDTGGGMFYWDPLEPAASDNKGTVFVRVPNTPGCWKRLFSGDVNTKWFGAKGDGQADDAAALEKAMNFACSNGLRCYIPKTNQWYHMTRGIRVHATAGQVIDIYSNGALIKPNVVIAQPADHLAPLTGFDERHFFGLGEGGAYGSRELNRNITVKLEGLTVDGSALASPFAPKDTTTTPVGWAFVAAAEFVYIRDCQVNNLFGTAFELYSPGILRIDDCITKNTGGRGSTPTIGEADKDQIGNAVHIAYAREGGDLVISASGFTGKLVTDPITAKTIRTRTGIVSEFSYENYELRVINTRLDHFAKTIHVEHKKREGTGPVQGTCKLYLEGVTFDHFNTLQAYANCGGTVAVNGCNITFRDGDTNDDGYSGLYVGQYASEVTLEFTGCKIKHAGGNRRLSMVGVSLFETCQFTFEQEGHQFADAICKMIHCTFINFSTDANTGHFYQTEEKAIFTLIACTFTGNTGVISYPTNANVRPDLYFINCFDEAGFGLKSNYSKSYGKIFDNADGSCFGGRSPVISNFAINPDNIPTNCWNSRQSFGLILYGHDDVAANYFSRNIIANPGAVGGYYLLRVRWTTNGHAYDIHKVGDPATKGFDLTYAYSAGSLRWSAAATGGANVKKLEYMAFPIELWNQVVPPAF